MNGSYRLTIRLVVLVTLEFVATRVEAGDVDFKLGIKESAAVSESTTIRPPTIVVADRVWAAPGVEQTTNELSPPTKCDFTIRQRFRIEMAEGCRSAGLNTMRCGGPDWLDDVAWPLTRELYGLGQSGEVFCQNYCQNEFAFGGIRLQR